MFKKILVVAAISTVTVTAFADDTQVQKAIPLNDGSTVYIFNDGKMAMENPYGRVERMQPGHVMEASNGQKIVMQSDEVVRLNLLLHPADQGG